MDVKSAFLHAEMDQDVYVVQPQGFCQESDSGTRLVWRMKKVLYGLKQAPLLWQQHVKTHLTKVGFKQSVFDQCLYMKIEEENEPVYVIHHVDDFLVIGPKGKRL